MLEDRDYMRADYRERPATPFHWSPSVVLMVLLVLAFLFQCIDDVYGTSRLELELALTADALGHAKVWQLLTFQFLHASLWHLIGNLIGLWFIGRFVESVLGTSRFLVAYFGCGVAGGILQTALMLVFPSHFANYVVGASAGVMGIFAIFALLLRDSVIRLNFILPIRADVLLWISGAISLFFTVVPSHRGGMVAHAAHLGGLLGGLLWVKLGWHRDYVRLPWEGRGTTKRSTPHAAPPRHTEPNSEEEDLSRQVDAILDKISAKGIHSLSDRERRTLEDARKKLGRR